MNILLINGPNINLLGVREPEVYGHDTYLDLVNLVRDYCEKNNHELTVFQSNHEGELLDFIQNNYKEADGIVINPAAYTHTSIALYDCLRAIDIPSVEVHISKVNEREAFRQVNYISSACIDTIMGEGISGYISAIKILERRFNERN